MGLACVPLLQVLIADFFFILVALAWLAAGVGEKSTLNSSVKLNFNPSATILTSCETKALNPILSEAAFI